jgi:hypothetical protein
MRPAGIPVDDRAVLRLAASLREVGFVDNRRMLERAHDREARIVALDIPTERPARARGRPRGAARAAGDVAAGARLAAAPLHRSAGRRSAHVGDPRPGGCSPSSNSDRATNAYSPSSRGALAYPKIRERIAEDEASALVGLLRQKVRLAPDPVLRPRVAPPIRATTTSSRSPRRSEQSSSRATSTYSRSRASLPSSCLARSSMHSPAVDVSPVAVREVIRRTETRLRPPGSAPRRPNDPDIGGRAAAASARALTVGSPGPGASETHHSRSHHGESSQPRPSAAHRWPPTDENPAADSS